MMIRRSFFAVLFAALSSTAARLYPRGKSTWGIDFDAAFDGDLMLSVLDEDQGTVVAKEVFAGTGNFASYSVRLDEPRPKRVRLVFYAPDGFILRRTSEPQAVISHSQRLTTLSWRHVLSS